MYVFVFAGDDTTQYVPVIWCHDSLALFHPV